MSLPKAHKLYAAMNIIPNPDGTITRLGEVFPTVPPSTTDSNSPTLSKDVPINSSKNTWVRIFLPRNSLNLPPHKLPLLIFIHGGGFVLTSPAATAYHDFCSLAASKLGVLALSLSYRLAPEHRLPAAYDDALESLSWVKDGGDEWVRDYGDLSNCVLMGESAGANIAYHVGLNIAAKINDFKPLVIKGLVLIQPFIGGLDRSGSEIELANNPVVPLESTDFCWELCLPFGANRNHEYCDVIKDGGSGLVGRVRELGWWVVVVGCDGDLLIDRNVELAKLLEGKGVNVKTMFVKDGQHGMFVSGDNVNRVELLDFVQEVWP